MSNQLSAGQQLGSGERIASLSGEFELVMQADGNLVLYRLGVTPSWYWSTGTWVLPESERPVRAVMQMDGHFVLYDADNVFRWASGSWGPVFADSILELQEDGNLIVRDVRSHIIWATGRPGGAAAVTGRGYVERELSLSEGVDSAGRLPPVFTQSQALSTFSTQVSTGGVTYDVISERRRQTEEIVEQSFLADMGSLGVWPGQIIQGRALLGGDVAPVGPLPRRSGTINIVTDLISSNHADASSSQVLSPSSESINAARRDMLLHVGPTDSSGVVRASIEKADSLREVGLKLKLNIKGINFNIDANMSLTESFRETSAVAVIRQVFYSTTFTPGGSQADGFWTKDVTYDALGSYVAAGNPPLFIDSVQYGRLICVLVQGSFSSSELTAALKANLTGFTSGSASVEARLKDVLNASRAQIYTIGVPGYLGFTKLADPISELETVYQTGRRFSLDNPGSPISFTARHIADNTLASVALFAEFVQPLKIVGPDVVDLKYDVWDGPGGGLKDTGINVNPGDNVSISTGGRIASGVVLSDPHGPEGWPGHAPDSGAPIPDKRRASAYSLIASFGGARDSWFEAGRYWEGVVPAGAGPGRRLLLGINDNNPYNGDRKFKWTSTVNVRRGNAEAAGIYI